MCQLNSPDASKAWAIPRDIESHLMLEWLGNGASERSHTPAPAQVSHSVKCEEWALNSKVGPFTLRSCFPELESRKKELGAESLKHCEAGDSDASRAPGAVAFPEQRGSKPSPMHLGDITDWRRGTLSWWERPHGKSHTLSETLPFPPSCWLPHTFPAFILTRELPFGLHTRPVKVNLAGYSHLDERAFIRLLLFECLTGMPVL